MKKLAVVFLCIFASDAFASSADSGICPWKMPFRVTINGVGRTHTSVSHWISGYIQRDTDYGYQTSSEGFQVTVDTLYGFNHYSLSNNILFFLESSSENSPLYYHSQLISITINFAPGKDSIISLSYSELDTG